MHNNLVSIEEYLFSRLTSIFYESNLGVAFLGIDNHLDAIWNVLKFTGYQKKLKYIVDVDNGLNLGNTFQHYRICQLKEIDLNAIDTIVVLPKDINRTLTNTLRQTLKGAIQKIKAVGLFSDYTADDLKEYVEYCEKAIFKPRDDFVDFNAEKFVPNKNDTKVIAYYLPQFHQIEINNKFHGQGFTEWTNTSRAIPLFAGHYQPHIPYDVGYYDLKNPDAMKRQIELAKHYGVHGFCFYYYWFSGQKLMEAPLEMLKAHEEWDMPFCVMWANENWTSRWDGDNKNVMIAQDFYADNDEKFMADLIPYMKDKRYMKVDGKPILSIYRCTLLTRERFCQMIEKFRQIAKLNGFPGLFVMITNSFYFDEDVTAWNADALLEYQPFMMNRGLPEILPKGYLHPNFVGKIFDTDRYIAEKKYLQRHSVEGGQLVRSALTQWDNTARRSTLGSWIYPKLTPQTYKTWLKDIIAESKIIHKNNRDMDMVFVNAWNEWAEGSHLEPDCRYGYAYLQATREALEEAR